MILEAEFAAALTVMRLAASHAVAEAVGVCPRTVRKWVDRYSCEGIRD
jgi:transposase-like protein